MSRNITSFPIPTRDIAASDVPFSSDDLESTNVNDAIEEVNDRFDDYRTITSQDLIDNAQSTSITNLQTAVQMNINVWDEMWEVGFYDLGSGAKISANDAIRNVNKIPVNPSTSYYVKIPYTSSSNKVYVYWYDSNGSFISRDDSTLSAIHTSPSTAYYMCFAIANLSQATYNHDISINYPSSFTGYYPSALPKEIAERKDEDFMLAMDGFISPTINGIKNYWDGSLYHRRIARVDLGSLEWVSNPAYGFYANTSISGIKQVSNGDLVANMICTKFDTASQNTAMSFTGLNKIGLVANSGLLVVSTTGTDAATFKASMSGTFLYYELATEHTLNIDANGLRFELLWTNASPSSAFASQTISVDLSKYRFCAIEYRENIGNNGGQVKILAIGTYNYVSFWDYNTNNKYGRSAYLYSDAVSFSYGYANNVQDDNSCIPCKIYGVR